MVATAMPMGHLDAQEREKVLMGEQYDAQGVRDDVRRLLAQHYRDPVLYKRARLLSEAFTAILLNRQGVDPYAVCSTVGMAHPP